MNSKLIEQSKMETNKMEVHFKEIHTRRNTKYDSENSALVYYSVKKHTAKIDSVLDVLVRNSGNNISNDKVVNKYLISNNLINELNFYSKDLKIKLNTITEFNSHNKIDSLIGTKEDLKSENLRDMPLFSVAVALNTKKLNGIKAGEILLSELNKKTSSNFKLNKK